MTRALHRCRWCGTPPPPSDDPQGRGRPPTFCSDQHRRRFHRHFNAPAYDGAIELITSCTHEGCELPDSRDAIPGPVQAPGAWLAAARVAATALHGHPVDVRLRPVATGHHGDFAFELAHGSGGVS